MVLVTKHLTQECILGVDFLIKHACVVDLRQHTFVIDGKICSLIIQGYCK